MNRRVFVRVATAAGISTTSAGLFADALGRNGSLDDLTVESLRHAEQVAGLTFTVEQRQTILEGVLCLLN